MADAMKPSPPKPPAPKKPVVHKRTRKDIPAATKEKDISSRAFAAQEDDQKRSRGYAPYIQLLINAKIGKHAYQIYRPHLPLQPEFMDNEVVMDDTHPSSTTAREVAEAARNAPGPPPQLKTRDEQMSFLVSTIRGMEKNTSEILLNQKSLERIVEKSSMTWM
ncbi:hypothetical protein ZWY2020_041983 [Hordeum vulgare]|nr:hypothetical protein ZWY2020_041983 [Hordeum vulgare]